MAGYTIHKKTRSNGGSGGGKSVVSSDGSLSVKESENSYDISRKLVLQSSDGSVIPTAVADTTPGEQKINLKAVPTFEVHSNGATTQIVNDEAQPGYYKLLSIQMSKVSKYAEADRYTAFLMIDGTGATYETERDFSIINIHFAVHWSGSDSIVDQTVLCNFGSCANASCLYYVETSDTNNHYITIYTLLPYKSNAIRIFILNEGYFSYNNSLVRTWYDSRRPTYQVGKTTDFVKLSDEGTIPVFYTQNTDESNKVFYPYTVSENGNIYLTDIKGSDYITFCKQSSLHTLNIPIEPFAYLQADTTGTFTSETTPRADAISILTNVNVTVSKIELFLTQSGNYQLRFAIYDVTRIKNSNTYNLLTQTASYSVTTNTTGLINVPFLKSITLESNKMYYVAYGVTGNGVLFCGKALNVVLNNIYPLILSSQNCFNTDSSFKTNFPEERVSSSSHFVPYFKIY